MFDFIITFGGNWSLNKKVKYTEINVKMEQYPDYSSYQKDKLFFSECIFFLTYIFLQRVCLALQKPLT